MCQNSALFFIPHRKQQKMQFVESFNMKSFYVSAKTGDNVSTCFHKVAADLAGITLTKPEVFF